MFANNIANTMTFVHKSTMVQNVRHIISKYNLTHHEVLYMYISAIKFQCKEMRNVYGNAEYYDYANMICELVVIRYCNNASVLNSKHNIICFLMAVFIWNFIMCLICTCLWILSPKKDGYNNNNIYNMYSFSKPQ